MISSPIRQAATASLASELPVLEWRVHLARSRPQQAALAFGAVLLGAGLVGLACHHYVWSLISGLLLLLACSEYFFPISYRLTPREVSSRNLLSWRKMTWDRVRHCYSDQHGIKLSPLGRGSRLEAYRGIYLWFGEGNRDHIIKAVRQWRSQGQAD